MIESVKKNGGYIMAVIKYIGKYINAEDAIVSFDYLLQGEMPFRIFLPLFGKESFFR